MKKIISSINGLFIIAVCSFFFVPAFSVTVPAAEPVDSMAGPAFTDSSEIMEMPEEWIRQPVKYEQSAGDADLAITLDQHLYPACLPLIQEYAKVNGMKIFVNEGTCGISAGMISRKTVDIGGYCCSPGITDRLPGLRFHTIGISALALFVHPENPVEDITMEQARQIFAGEIYRWSELESKDGTKGPNLPIQPIGRLHCKLRPGHWRLLLDNQDLFSAALQEVGAIPDMISKVASNKRAIGYEVLWNSIRYKDRGRVKPLKIDGYSPDSQEALASGKFPMYRVYSLTTWEGKGIERAEAKKMVEYIIKQSEVLEKEHSIVPAFRLREVGWKFKGNELVGEPEKLK
ncbi:MAG: substrate-binding domain-containing protein [Nitrospirota bacterium]